MLVKFCQTGWQTSNRPPVHPFFSFWMEVIVLNHIWVHISRKRCSCVTHIHKHTLSNKKINIFINIIKNMLWKLKQFRKKDSSKNFPFHLLTNNNSLMVWSCCQSASQSLSQSIISVKNIWIIQFGFLFVYLFGYLLVRNIP